MQPISYSEALLEGLAPDGGLAVPEHLPRLSIEQIESWRGLRYAELAVEVLSLFATDIPRAELVRMCAAAYSRENFAVDEIVPLTEIEPNLLLLGLSEGPTLAFKDMAMQYLGQSLEYALRRQGSVLNVVGATSGDT